MTLKITVQSGVMVERLWTLDPVIVTENETSYEQNNNNVPSSKRDILVEGC